MNNENFIFRHRIEQYTKTNANKKRIDQYATIIANKKKIADDKKIANKKKIADDKIIADNQKIADKKRIDQYATIIANKKSMPYEKIIEQNNKIIQDKSKQLRGNMLWKELHTRAYNHNGTNDDDFITQFGKKIPRFMTGCSCNEFWIKWIQTNPPKYGINEYFEWTVKCHNAVNTKLGKAIMSLENAKKSTRLAM